MRFSVIVAAVLALCLSGATGRADEKKSAPKQVFVVNTQDASVSLVDLATMKELKRYEVGKRPYGITVSQDGKIVAVGVEDEECVKFFSLPDFKLKGKTPIGKMFNDHIVLTQEGKHVLVANFYSDDVVAIDIETMKESYRIKDCSAPHVVKFGPLKKHAFVTCKKVTGIAVIDPVAQKQVKVIPLNVNPRSLTFSPDEKTVYFGSFWVDGFFALDMESGKVTKLFKFDPPKGNTDPQEVTYHGVEMLTDKVLVAANEGRSHVDAVDVTSGQLLDRLSDVSKPCCVEKIPGQSGASVKFLISNIGDNTLQLAELTAEGKLRSLGNAEVGKAPKRVAFLP
jgi:YVTN family beta-propeller protein